MKPLAQVQRNYRGQEDRDSQKGHVISEMRTFFSNTAANTSTQMKHYKHNSQNDELINIRRKSVSHIGYC